MTRAETIFAARLRGIEDERQGHPAYPALPTRAERVAYWRGRAWAIKTGEAFDFKGRTAALTG